MHASRRELETTRTITLLGFAATCDCGGGAIPGGGHSPSSCPQLGTVVPRKARGSRDWLYTRQQTFIVVLPSFLEASLAALRLGKLERQAGLAVQRAQRHGGRTGDERRAT